MSPRSPGRKRSSETPISWALFAPRGYAQSYEKGDGRAEASGTLTAPFTGIHGWYWENPTNQEITVTLTTAGFYNLAHEFRTGVPVKNKNFQ